MEEFSAFIIPLISLSGVIVGGVITYFTQKALSQRQLDWEEQKFHLETERKNTEIKIEVYNKILFLDVDKDIMEWVTPEVVEFRLEKYAKYTRPQLFRIYHLLSDDIISEINRLDNAFDEMRLNENSKDEDDEIDIRMDPMLNYFSIIKSIRDELKK